ncbi:MAG: hypothetical protein WKF86_00160 [Acidimicrobiales bacterium]
MGTQRDAIAATVTLKADGAIRDLGTLSRKAKETDRAFGDTARSTRAAGVKTAEGISKSGAAATGVSGGYKRLRGDLLATSTAFGTVTLAAGVVASAGAGLFSVANAASQLNEQVNASKATFGSAAGAVRDFSRTTADGLGISAASSLKASSAFGAFFKQAGFADQASARMSTTLVQLGGDLASFKDIPTDDALAAISSGLAGESEPLRRLGVDLRATKVDAEAMALGFATSKGAITETDRVAARYTSLLRQTGDAQGDAARTSNEYANAQRRLSASTKDFKGGLGQALTSGLSDALNGVNAIFKSIETRSLKPIQDNNNPVKQEADRLAAAAKIYNDAVGTFGENSPQATDAVSRLRSEVDAAEATAQRTGLAFESTARATARMAEESAAAANTVRGLVDAQRGAEDATLKVTDSRRAVGDAERTLSDLRGKGKVDAEAVADAERDLADSSRGVADSRRRVGDAERTLEELRRKGPVDAAKVADAEQSVAEATRSVRDARRGLIEAEKELAKFRRGDEARDAGQEVDRADIDLERAKQRQIEAQRNLDKSSGRGRAEAALDLRDANLDLADAEDRVRDSREAQAGLPEKEAGLERNVADSRDRVRDSADKQGEAEAALRLARAGDPDFSRNLAAAEREVESARRGVDEATRGADRAAADLRTARAGDPDFERNMAGAIRDAERARRELEHAEQDLPFATDNAKRVQEDFNIKLNEGSDAADRLRDKLYQLRQEELAIGPIGTGTVPGNRKGLPTYNAQGYAAGGIVRASAAGTIIRVGEGGRDEAIVPLNNDGTVAKDVLAPGPTSGTLNSAPSSASGSTNAAPNVAIHVAAPLDSNIMRDIIYAGQVVNWQLSPSGRR